MGLLAAVVFDGDAECKKSPPFDLSAVVSFALVFVGAAGLTFVLSFVFGFAAPSVLFLSSGIGL